MDIVEMLPMSVAPDMPVFGSDSVEPALPPQFGEQRGVATVAGRGELDEQEGEVALAEARSPVGDHGVGNSLRYCTARETFDSPWYEIAPSMPNGTIGFNMPIEEDGGLVRVPGLNRRGAVEDRLEVGVGRQRSRLVHASQTVRADDRVDHSNRNFQLALQVAGEVVAHGGELRHGLPASPPAIRR
jgi:hypothetical protein